MVKFRYKTMVPVIIYPVKSPLSVRILVMNLKSSKVTIINFTRTWCWINSTIDLSDSVIVLRRDYFLW